VYSVGAVARITGLSTHALRAWERRYGAVRPHRTEGGTRRYSRSQVERLRLLKAGVDAGHRISEIAELDDATLEARIAAGLPDSHIPLADVLAAAIRVDAEAVDRLLGIQLAALGPTGFARDVAGPLLRDVGDRWARGELTVAQEHLISSTARGLLATALRAPANTDGPRLVFSTPSGERHEFGALIAAAVALGAGASVTYLGPDLPADELARAARGIGARAVGLSVVGLPLAEARSYLGELRAALPARIEIWVGGPGDIDGVEGVERLDLDELERRTILARG
jgi:DNA-binding transcriptional MerR regulator/methylmalonyl-CoA mutase cobalamin-binding subunit